MLSIFIGIASVFVDSGFSSALIQKQNITQEDTSSVFFFNLGIGIVMGVCLCIGAPWIANFFNIPLLKPLTRLMALNLVLGALGSVHIALLTKELDYRTQMRISIIASAVSGGIAVFLAWRGWGVWSLVLQTILSTLVSNGLLWYWRPWRPSLVFSFASLRTLFRFGSYLLFSGMLNVLYGRLNTLVIGKLYSARDLGFYTRADRTQQLPASLISSVIARVAFPVFSAISEDKEVLKRGVQKAITTLMMINVPVMLGTLATSRPLVQTLLGEKWLPCVPYLQVLCLAGVFLPLHSINLSALKAQGRSDLFFRLEVVKKILGITALLITCKISVLAMAWSQVGLGVASYVLNAYYSGTLLQYSFLNQLRDILPYLLTGGVMLAFIWPIVLITSLPSPLLLILQVIAGILVYGTLCIFFKFPAFSELLTTAKGGLKRIKSTK